MNNPAYKFVLCLMLLIISTMPAMAQEGGMAEILRSDGKIWVVVGVITIILVGLFIFLFWLEKRIKRLENLQK